MKTKFQTLGCLFTALVVFSTSAFAGDPTSVGSANNGSQDNSTMNIVAPNTAILVNPLTSSSTTGVTANSSANAESNAILSDNTANVNGIDNTNSILSYHHGSSSSSSGNGGIDGKNVVFVGVGFVSLVGLFASTLSFAANAATAAGGTNVPKISSIPAIDLGYERGVGHFGVGLRFTYQEVSASSAGSYIYDGSQGPNGTNGETVNYTDKATITGIAFMATGAYHFGDNPKVDPYLGLAFGYTSLSLGYSTSGDPNASTDGNSTAPVFGIGGVSFGGDVGVRLFFTDNIGAWIDLGYWGYGGAIFNLGLAFKF
jgi:hypothetical protein